MNARLCVCVVTLVTVVAVAVVAEEENESLPTEASELIQFNGKIMILSVDKSSALEKGSQSSSLAEARLIEIGDRYFIVGKLHAPKEYLKDYPHVGAVVGYPWENVESFLLMDPEQYDDYVEAYRRRNE